MSGGGNFFCLWAGIIGPFSNRFKVSVASLGVVLPLAPNFHFLSKCLSSISTIVCQQLGYMWT